MRPKKIVLTVTNDLNYDQRMIRICHSLATHDYQVLLVGRKMKNSLPLQQQLFKQKRLFCFFKKGMLFYVEYNIRLFFFLLFLRMDAICAIDLDTILPCYLISRLRGITRIYDAHELFCEMKEIVTRPHIYRFWKRVERNTVPHFRYGYTVNSPIAQALEELYGVKYTVIRNVTRLDERDFPPKPEKYILYQGAVNEGRSFETLLPAMQWVDARLIICGEGNFFNEAHELVKKYKLEEKVLFKGRLLPKELLKYTTEAYIGITLFDTVGKSNYYSLANRFFDYIHAGVPQLCVDYPAYKEINKEFEVALLTQELSSRVIAGLLNNLLNDTVFYNRLQHNCIMARQVINWQQEEKKLITFYKNILE